MSNTRDLTVFVRDRGGNVAIMFGLLTPLLFGAASIALDYSSTAKDRTKAQAAADAAALAAVLKANNSSGSVGARMQLAKEEGAHVFKADAEGLQITSTNVTVTEKLDGASVTAWGKTRFKLLQITDILEYSYKVHANAGALNVAPICLLATDTAGAPGIVFKGNGTFKGPDCVVWSNSTTSSALRFQGSSNVSAKLICAVGGVQKQGSNTITPAPEAQCEPFADPFAGWTPPSFATACTSSNVTKSGNDVTLSPGVYCGNSTISADYVKMLPGVYVIRNGTFSVKGKTEIKGNDVVILMSGTSSLDLNSSGDLSITASPTLATRSVVIGAADASSSGSVTLTGNSKLEVQGTIYLPKHTIDVTGNADLVMTEPQTTIVGKSISVDGSGSIIFKGKDKGNSPRWIEGTSVVRLTE